MGVARRPWTHIPTPLGPPNPALFTGSEAEGFVFINAFIFHETLWSLYKRVLGYGWLVKIQIVFPVWGWRSGLTEEGGVAAWLCGSPCLVHNHLSWRWCESTGAPVSSSAGVRSGLWSWQPLLQPSREQKCSCLNNYGQSEWNSDAGDAGRL